MGTNFGRSDFWDRLVRTSASYDWLMLLKGTLTNQRQRLSTQTSPGIVNVMENTPERLCPAIISCAI